MNCNLPCSSPFYDYCVAIPNVHNLSYAAINLLLAASWKFLCSKERTLLSLDSLPRKKISK